VLVSGRDLPEEGDVSSCDLQGFGGNDIVGWQFADFDASTMLGRGQGRRVATAGAGY
jgi:hypothetical protein